MLQQLTGTYYTEYTSATPFDCERITYSTDQYNVTTGHLEYPDCCLLIDNLDYVSNQLNYDIDPAPSPYSSCSGISSTTGSFKLLDSFGSGSSHCLIFAVCKSDYYGINVMCRGQVPLFADVVAIVINLLGFLTQTQVLEMSTVRQTDCVIPTNNCPAFPA